MIFFTSSGNEGAGFTPLAPLTLSGATLAIPKATASADGYLAATDWTTFNAKQPALGFIPLDTASSNQMAAPLVLAPYIGSFPAASSYSGGLIIYKSSPIVPELAKMLYYAKGGTWQQLFDYVAPGTSGNVLTSNGSVWASSALPVFSGSAPGLVPTSAGGTVNFLRADGTFAQPPLTPPAGASGALQYNASGAFGAVPGWSTDANGQVTATAQGATYTPFTVNGVTGQTADLQDWKVNGVGVASISPLGYMTVSTTNPQFLGVEQGQTRFAFGSLGGIAYLENTYGANWFSFRWGPSHTETARFTATYWQFAVPITFGSVQGTPQTSISQASAGVAQIGNGGANALGSLLLTNLTASGTVTASAFNSATGGTLALGGTALTMDANGQVTATAQGTGYTPITVAGVVGQLSPLMLLRSSDGTSGLALSPTTLSAAGTNQGLVLSYAGNGGVAIGNALASGINAIAIGRSNATASNTGAIAIGGQATAAGGYSLAMGDTSYAASSRDMAIGYYATSGASSSAGIAFGNFTLVNAANAMVIGNGVNTSNKLTNSIASSIALGTNSTIPTLFIGPSAGAGTFGKVGIGTTTLGAELTINGDASLANLTASGTVTAAAFNSATGGTLALGGTALTMDANGRVTATAQGATYTPMTVVGAAGQTAPVFNVIGTEGTANPTFTVSDPTYGAFLKAAYGYSAPNGAASLTVSDPSPGNANASITINGSNSNFYGQVNGVTRFTFGQGGGVGYLQWDYGANWFRFKYGATEISRFTGTYWQYAVPIVFGTTLGTPQTSISQASSGVLQVGNGTANALGSLALTRTYLQSATPLVTPIGGTLEYQAPTLFFTPIAIRRSVMVTSAPITSSVVVTNTTTETTIYTCSFDANSMSLGRMIDARVLGVYSTSNASDTFTVRAYFDGVLIATINSPAGQVTNAELDLQLIATVRTTGATGSIITFLLGHVNDINKGQGASSTTTIDTTVASDLHFTVQWSSATIGDTVSIDQGITRFIN